MVSQLTVYAKILCLLMTLFSAGAATRNDYSLQSACSLKFLRAKNGTVFADDNVENGQPQVFSLNATRTRDNRVAITIYSKETDSYICFDKNWRTKTMRGKANMSKRRCMFFENIDATGAFRYQSVANQNRFLGFLKKNGKPVGGLRAGGGGGGGQAAKVVGPGGVVAGRKRHMDVCYNFSPVTPEAFNDVQQQHAYSQPQQRQEAKVARPQQQSNQLQPRQRHHRQQAQRKDVSAGEGNALLASSYAGGTSEQRQSSPPHRHRHKHGAGGRQGKLQQGHPNLDSGFTGATASPALPPATLSSLYGSAYGKGTHHRRTQLNSPVSGDDASMLPAALSALVTKLPPKSSAHAGHLGSALGLLDGAAVGGTVPGTIYRKERPALEPTNGGRVSSGHVGGNSKKKSPNSSNNNGTSGRNASSKVSTMRGRDKRASG
ncbi:uncharacterized protein LOC118504267 isoform X2 [Anopheles stephensi]|uniref:uncharacterized protein LOC118504267 isoform X2 n=1 Tax=Anopheles stephensi TaxID=30069 RepID=UPI001658ACB2|nr:uncharacterized protein LOC118504267 isoform X2 [Anopheles stephensi]XP_035894391.1 uncharacterized protein LOC118504267 isoform X2 [Anopheles stephensi]XP_035894392.1 uncharacterized protein LOC118504267 isoform X2 [Anopheles stephensi]XP_035894393.1 uncharacterized protein LOC118504267 isoform X2 [Anopheles stephensi]XP_035894394.1 uncharacterized protein LOC118504267 isoform X2 [Anopheles stephensi]